MTPQTISVRVVVVDRFTPAVREVSYRLGRVQLAYYLSKPWYWRLWWDIRHSRVLSAITSLKEKPPREG